MTYPLHCHFTIVKTVGEDCKYKCMWLSNKTRPDVEVFCVPVMSCVNWHVMYSFPLMCTIWRVQYKICTFTSMWTDLFICRNAVSCCSSLYIYLHVYIYVSGLAEFYWTMEYKLYSVGSCWLTRSQQLIRTHDLHFMTESRYLLFK